MTDMINPMYLEAATIQQLSQHFHRDPEFKSTILLDFLTPAGLQLLEEEEKNLSFVPSGNPIVSRGDYAQSSDLITDVFTNQIFIELISRITGEAISFDTIQAMQYSHRGYQIIHDDAILPPGVDVILDLTPTWDDEMGGTVVYTDGSGQFYTIPSNYGSLAVIKRPAGLHFFVKYVNHYADNLHRNIIIGNSTVER